MVSEVSIKAGVFSLLDEFWEVIVSGGLEGFPAFDEYVLLIRLEGFDEFASFDEFAGVSQFFCTTAYCVWKSTGSA